MYFETLGTYMALTGNFKELWCISLSLFFFADPFGCWPPCLQEQRFHENFNAVKDRVEHELLRVNENIPNCDLKRLVMCFQLL